VNSNIFYQQIRQHGVAGQVTLDHGMPTWFRHHSRKWIPWMFLVIMSVFVGCTGTNDDFSRVVISGEVTFSEEPVPYGMIRFVPEKGSKLPVAAATIEAGRYNASNKGGIPVGTYRVEITGYRQPLVDNVPLETGNPQYLPEKYNRHSEIELAIDLKTVSTLDFHLK